MPVVDGRLRTATTSAHTGTGRGDADGREMPYAAHTFDVDKLFEHPSTLWHGSRADATESDIASLCHAALIDVMHELLGGNVLDIHK